MAYVSKVEENRRKVIVHVKQTLDLLELLMGDIGRFRMIDEGRGRNDESVKFIEQALEALQEVSSRLKFVVVRSDAAYGKMKDVYLAMQDVQANLTQAVKRPETSSKDLFIAPFRTLARNLQASVNAFTSVLAAVSSTDMPNPSILSVQYQLGLAHLHGLEGRPINHSAAVECFSHAAKEGNTEAMLCLARCYINGQGVDRNEAKGVEWLTMAANSHVCPHAQNELAMLIIGNLKESNPLCVKEYCATLMDDASAARSLRRSHTESAHRGNGNEYGVEDAIKLLLTAAAEGCADAKSNLGAIYEEAGDLEQAATWYEQASSEGCTRGTYLLGHLFLRGKLTASKTRTFALLRQAALGGQPEAYCYLGTCYEQGVGTDVNIPLAVESYRRSASKGSKLGMYSLGYLLVQNAIEMRRQVKQLRPYVAAGAERRTHLTSAAVVEHNQVDEKCAYLETEAEATLQEGIHWLRSASENHVKDAAFQLGRLYEQALGVPNDSHAALANYKWAAFLGHTKAAFFAGNLLYEQATARNAAGFCEAARYYHQAAMGGIVEAMNSYAILLEDGRASEAGIPNLHLAAAWYYQACVERERMDKAFINLAMLMCTTPLSSFRTIPGDIVTLSDAKDFLLDYFESDAFKDEERRIVLLQMIDSIDEHSPTALPLVEEVSLSLASTRRSVRAPDYRSHSPGPKVVSITDEDEEQPIDVKRVPVSLRSSADRNYSTSTRVNRIHEEVHKLSRGPIQNQGRNYTNTVAESQQAPLADTAPPVHGALPRPGELYTTDGPVIPPSFAPRAIQFTQPSFKPDKPPHHTKPSAVPVPQTGPTMDTAVKPPSVPLLVSPRKSGGGSESAAKPAPARPPKNVERKGSSENVATRGGAASAQRSMSAQRALHAPIPAEDPPAAKTKPAKRMSFISGLVHMMARSGDHGGDHLQSQSQHGSDEHKADGADGAADHSVPAPQPSLADDGAGRTSQPTKRPSVWKSLKNGVSKSLDLPRSQTPSDQRMPTAAASGQNEPAPTNQSVSKSGGMWGAVRNAAGGGNRSTSHSVDATVPAQGVFASEPQPVASPAKPPKPQAMTAQPVPQTTSRFLSPNELLRTQQQALQQQQRPVDVGAGAAAAQPSADLAAPAAAEPSAGTTATSVDSRDASPSKRGSILTKIMLQSKHKKYLQKDATAGSDAAPAPAAAAAPAAEVAVQAATSTGTMDTAASAGEGSERDDLPPPPPVRLPSNPPARAPSSGGPGPVFMNLPGESTAYGDPNDTVMAFEDSLQFGAGAGQGDSFDPVSDLSLSSRDIRY